ncbi:hypothetical protein HispidOSU_027787 [Sigmodon hispidus]
MKTWGSGHFVLLAFETGCVCNRAGTQLLHDNTASALIATSLLFHRLLRLSQENNRTADWLCGQQASDTRQ